MTSTSKVHSRTCPDNGRFCLLCWYCNFREEISVSCRVIVCLKQNITSLYHFDLVQAIFPDHSYASAAQTLFQIKKPKTLALANLFAIRNAPSSRVRELPNAQLPTLPVYYIQSHQEQGALSVPFFKF